MKSWRFFMFSATELHFDTIVLRSNNVKITNYKDFENLKPSLSKGSGVINVDKHFNSSHRYSLLSQYLNAFHEA